MKTLIAALTFAAVVASALTGTAYARSHVRHQWSQSRPPACGAIDDLGNGRFVCQP